ncbi:MAG: efflux RND transporter periplasmic adaptor subunit [Nitrospirae bacterium]|nr:efflux RND transporter periplasmic adaptor subunit [Nitrospirota bacterium]
MNMARGRRRIAENGKQVLLPLALCLFLSLSCHSKVEPGTAAVSRPTVDGVTVEAVQQSEVDEYLETSGTIKAKTISRIASRIIGGVTSVRVKEGDRVRTGQTLLTIDDRDAAQRVISAEKSVEAALQNKSLADVTYQRYKRLFDEKAVSQQEIDQIDSQRKIADLDYEKSKAMLNEARVNRGFASILSPVSGVVTEKKIELGSMAMPGVPLLTVEDTSSFTVEANLDEHLSGKVAPGLSVSITVGADNQEVKGTIAEVVPAIDPSSRTFLAKISLASPALRSGLYARVKIPAGRKMAIVVPAASIVEKGQLTGIYTIDQGGIVTYRLVRTGMRYGNGVEILSGLSVNDRIISGGLSKAVDGGILAEAVKQ